MSVSMGVMATSVAWAGWPASVSAGTSSMGSSVRRHCAGGGGESLVSDAVSVQPWSGIGWSSGPHALVAAAAVEEGRKIYMYALTKPHGSCRGSGGSDMHKQNKNQNRDIKHPTAECRKA